MVLVNPAAQNKQVSIEPSYARFSDRQAPGINNGFPAKTIVLPAMDGILLFKLR